MDLKQEIERTKRNWNGIAYWSAMDLFRFLELADWNDFKKKIKDIQTTEKTTPSIINYVVNGVTDYWMTPEVVFKVLSKIDSDRDRYVFAINYFVQLIIDKQRKQQATAIDVTKKEDEISSAQMIEIAFKDLCKRNSTLVKKSNEFYMISDWFVPKLINELNNITGDNFMADMNLILSTYLDIVKAKQKEFGFSDEAVNRLSYDINFAYSVFEGYVAKERGDR